MRDGLVEWAILGTGGIVRSGFLPALAQAAGGHVAVIASRDAARAAEMARHYGIARAYGDYRAVLADDRIDAVYIALPNALHLPWVLACVAAGKAVLCEKPLTLQAVETEQIGESSRAQRVPVWTAYAFRFHLQWRRVREAVQGGQIGRVQTIYGTFTTRLQRQDDIRWQGVLGGGALWDLGCYPVHLASGLLAEAPVQAVAQARWRGDVDQATSAILRYPSGAELIMHVAFDRSFDAFTRIVGDAG